MVASLFPFKKMTKARFLILENPCFVSFGYNKRYNRYILPICAICFVGLHIQQSGALFLLIVTFVASRPHLFLD
jgi:hypothetical protein